MRAKIALLLLLTAGLLSAQGERGTFNGTVTDPSGAALPEASVAARGFR